MTTLPCVPIPPSLTRFDRCDRCSAAAQLRAMLPAGELLFCGHHARQYQTRLLEIGARLSPDSQTSHPGAA
jgi:hypothetical protein